MESRIWSAAKPRKLIRWAVRAISVARLRFDVIIVYPSKYEVCIMFVPAVAHPISDAFERSAPK